MYACLRLSVPNISFLSALPISQPRRRLKPCRISENIASSVCLQYKGRKENAFYAFWSIVKTKLYSGWAIEKANLHMNHLRSTVAKGNKFLCSWEGRAIYWVGYFTDGKIKAHTKVLPTITHAGFISRASTSGLCSLMRSQDVVCECEARRPNKTWESLNHGVLRTEPEDIIIKYQYCWLNWLTMKKSFFLRSVYVFLLMLRAWRQES